MNTATENDSDDTSKSSSSPILAILPHIATNTSPLFLGETVHAANVGSRLSTTVDALETLNSSRQVLHGLEGPCRRTWSNDGEHPVQPVFAVNGSERILRYGLIRPSSPETHCREPLGCGFQTSAFRSVPIHSTLRKVIFDHPPRRRVASRGDDNRSNLTFDVLLSRLSTWSPLPGF